MNETRRNDSAKHHEQAASDRQPADAAAEPKQPEDVAAVELSQSQEGAGEAGQGDLGPVVADLEQQVAELKDRLLRAVAETENVRRRGQREVEDTSRYAIADFARALLPVADNLRRAVESVPELAREQNVDVANLLAGVELTERELHKVFQSFGISAIDPIGQKLDPNRHQAMMQVEDDAAEPGTVVQVVQIGYQLQDRLLRPALVGVASARKSASPSTEPVDTQA